MSTVRKTKKQQSRSGLKSAPNNGRSRRQPSNTKQQIPSHIVSKKENHFTEKRIDMSSVRQTDMREMLQITHEIKIGLNRFEMITDRFEKQKRILQNHNFKLITGGNQKNQKENLEEKQRQITDQLKNKRMVHALVQLREQGTQLDQAKLGAAIIDETVLDTYLTRLRREIKEQKEKTMGKTSSSHQHQPHHSAAVVKQSGNKVATSGLQQAQFQQNKATFQHGGVGPQGGGQQSLMQQSQQLTLTNSKSKLSSPSRQTKDGQKSIVQQPIIRADTLSAEQFAAYQKQLEDKNQSQALAQKLLDPSNTLDNLNREQLKELFSNENIFEEVANAIFQTQNQRNVRENQANPLMVKYETSLQQVKGVLEDVDQSDFCALRDLKVTPAQLHSRKLQKICHLQYSILDDLRESIGNENLKQGRFCGILNRLINQRAFEMGKSKKGYEQFYTDELCNNLGELPETEKCIKSMLSKENILRHKNDEELAKKLLRQARQKQIDLKSMSDENLLSSYNSNSKLFGKSSRARVKTLEELNAEKEAAVKAQRERAARERQLVLDNIHLLRLQEMYPEANITCSQQVTTLIDAYLRRNMVANEIEKEVAQNKLMTKKPRPFKLIRGLAVVRPTRYEYLDNDPAGNSRLDTKKNLTLLMDSSDEEADINNQDVADNGGSVSRNKGMRDQMSKTMPITIRQSTDDVVRSSHETNRIQIKQLDMGKITNNTTLFNNTNTSNQEQQQQEQNQSFQQQPFRISLVDPFKGVVDCGDDEGGTQLYNKAQDSYHVQQESKEYGLRSDLKVIETYPQITQSGVQKIPVQPLNSEPDNNNNDEFTLIECQTDDHTNNNTAGGTTSLNKLWKNANANSSQSIHESYLASNGQVMRLQNSNSEIPHLPMHVQSEHNAMLIDGLREDNNDSRQDRSNLSRDSPSLHFNLANRVALLGMFEQQKSEDLSTSDLRFGKNRLKNKNSPFSNHGKKSVTIAADLINLRPNSNKDNRFMDRVRRDAEQRRHRSTRNGAEHHLTLTGLKQSRVLQSSSLNRNLQGNQMHQRGPSSINGRFVCSARTIEGKELRSSQQKHMLESVTSPTLCSPGATPTINTFTSGSKWAPQRGDKQRSKENLDMQHLVFSNNTQTHSFLNSRLGVTGDGSARMAKTRAQSKPKQRPTTTRNNAETTNPNILSGEAFTLKSYNTDMTSAAGAEINHDNFNSNMTLHNAAAAAVNTNMSTNPTTRFITKPIQSYSIPVTADTRGTLSQSSSPFKPGDKASAAIHAHMNRFPVRDTHTVHVKRKLEANPSLNIFSKVDQEQQNQSSATNGMRMSQKSNQGLTSINQRSRRPVTGTIRSGATQMTATNNPIHNQTNGMAILEQQKQLLSSTAQFNNLQTESWLTKDEQQEFCDVPRSQLPDRILSFMENNDLPVYIDKKQYNTLTLNQSNSMLQQNRIRSLQHTAIDNLHHRHHHTSTAGGRVQQHINNNDIKRSIQENNSNTYTNNISNQTSTAFRKNQFQRRRDSSNKNVTIELDVSKKSQDDHAAMGSRDITQREINNYSQQFQTVTGKSDLSKTMILRPVSSKYAKQNSSSGMTIDKIENNAANQSNQTPQNSTPCVSVPNSKRRVVVHKDSESRVTNKTRTPHSQTPQIINIVNTAADKLINQDLGACMKDPAQEVNRSNIDKVQQSSDVTGNISERNQLSDGAEISLPAPLYQKSRTLREQGRNSAKLRSTGRTMSKQRASRTTTHRAISGSQMSQQARQKRNKSSILQNHPQGSHTNAVDLISPQNNYNAAITNDDFLMSSNDQNPIDDPQYIATATYNAVPTATQSVAANKPEDVIDF